MLLAAGRAYSKSLILPCSCPWRELKCELLFFFRMSHRYSISRSPIQGVLHTSDQLSLPRKKQEKEKRRKNKQNRRWSIESSLIAPPPKLPHLTLTASTCSDLIAASKQASKPRCFKLYSTPSLSPHRQHKSNTHLHSKLQQSNSKNKTQQTSSSPFFSSSSPSLPKSRKTNEKEWLKKQPTRTLLSSFSCTIPAPIHNWIPYRTSVSRSLSLSLADTTAELVLPCESTAAQSVVCSVKRTPA